MTGAMGPFPGFWRTRIISGAKSAARRTRFLIRVTLWCQSRRRSSIGWKTPTSLSSTGKHGISYSVSAPRSTTLSRWERLTCSPVWYFAPTAAVSFVFPRRGNWDESKYTYTCGKYSGHKEECTPTPSKLYICDSWCLTIFGQSVRRFGKTGKALPLVFWISRPRKQRRNWLPNRKR